jgi:DNA mismatch repair protein MutL
VDVTETRINILPETVANQIAAGEVIERPAAVLKELLENSLDAGATRIEIDVAGGGRKLVQVLDNGPGMWPDDVLLCLERHATSKIAAASDLSRIVSLGFRGEALPSVASVSRLTIMSRPPGAETGYRVKISGGRVQQTGEVAMDLGTVVTVADLFFNVPARRKFLRQASTEQGHLQTAFIRQALARPDVFFRLTADGRRVHSLPGQSSADRAAALLDPVLIRRGTEIDSRSGDLFLAGYIGPPTLTRPSGAEVYTFLNGRFIRDRLVNHALFSVFRGLLPKGRFPVAVLWIELDPGLVDVNVHPTKAEVRFRRPDFVYRALQAAVSDALGLTRADSPRPVFPRAAEPSSPPAGVTRSEARWPAPEIPVAVAEPELPPTVADQKPVQTSAGSPSAEADQGPDEGRLWSRPRRSPFEDLRVIGQLGASYVLAEGPGGLVIIDQHAAYERLAFERLKAGFSAKNPARQLLLVPAPVELGPGESGLVLDRAQWLERVGLEVEDFGGRTVVVKAVPAVLIDADPADLVRHVAEALADLDAAPATDQQVDDILAEMACQVSPRAGRRLGLDEMNALIADLNQSGVAPTCPHGRPFLWEIGLDEVARAFKR